MKKPSERRGRLIEFRLGHRMAEAGEKLDPNASKTWQLGYNYARRTLAMRAWSHKHNRAYVFDGPFPAEDPLPESPAQVELWLKSNERLLVAIGLANP
jgi:hypothetical protein